MVEVARITQFYLCFALYETLYHHLKRICSKFHAYLDLKLYWDFSNSLSAGNFTFELFRWDYFLSWLNALVLQKVKVFSEWHAVTTRVSARHCFPIFALGIEYFFAYQPTAENALEVLVVQKEVRRKWILNICIQNRRSSKFRFLFLVGNSYRIITHNSCRWQAVECQIKDWSIFEQTFTKWWMEQFHSFAAARAMFCILSAIT